MGMKNNILAHIQNEVGPKVLVTVSSDFVSDLAIDGDDVDDLFMDLQRKYPLDLDSEDWSEYFHSEGELISISHLFKKLGSKLGICSYPELRKLKPFTVGDLIAKYENKTQ